jgi:hypothetical protein
MKSDVVLTELVSGPSRLQEGPKSRPGNGAGADGPFGAGFRSVPIGWG